MKSLYARQLISTIALLMLSLAVLGVAFVTLTYGFLASESRGTLEKNARAVSRTAQAYMFGAGSIIPIDFNMVLSMVAEMGDTHVIVCTTAGMVIGSSDPPSSMRLGEVIDGGIVQSALSDQEFFEVGTLGGFYKKPAYIYGTSIRHEKGAQAIGAVFVSSPASGLYNMMMNFARIFGVVAALVLVVAAAFAHFSTRSMTRPLRLMAGAARDFAAGRFDTRVDAGRRRDEIGELAAAFNNMAASLERSDRLRKDFIANVSHELKTPMTTIAGYIDGILDGTIPPEKRENYLNVVSGEVRRLSRLVTKMLAISRLESSAEAPGTERFDICEAARLSILALAPKIEARGLDVGAELDSEVFVTAEKDSIIQVFNNLLENAVKFSHPGTTISFVIEKKGKKALVSISNSGDTIPEEEISMLFDRFHKADASRGLDREGLGLGLHIVKTILNNHHESVKVESRDGVTTFSFSLPLCDPAG